MDNFSCRHCNADLIIEGVPSGRACRCASCGELSFFAEKNLKQPKQALAWLCFWLGITTLSIMVVAAVLLFSEYPWSAGMLGLVAAVLGSFASYLGIKALLRTRYQKTPQSAKVAATIATLLGGCAGIFFGGIFACIFMIGLLFSYISVETNDAEEVRQMAEQYYDVELSQQVNWVPSDGETNPLFNHVEYWDDEKFGKSKSRFYVRWQQTMFVSGMGVDNRGPLKIGGMRAIMGGQRRFVEPDNTKVVVWMINGEEVDVDRIRWKRKADTDQPGDEFITYQTLVETESKTFCLTLLCKTPAEQLTDEQVKSIFESFVPR